MACPHRLDPDTHRLHPTSWTAQLCTQRHRSSRPGASCMHALPSSPTFMDSTVVYTAALKLAARRPESLRLPPAGAAASASTSQAVPVAIPSASAGHAVYSRPSGAVRVW